MVASVAEDNILQIWQMGEGAALGCAGLCCLTCCVLCSLLGWAGHWALWCRMRGRLLACAGAQCIVQDFVLFQLAAVRPSKLHCLPPTATPPLSARCSCRRAHLERLSGGALQRSFVTVLFSHESTSIGLLLCNQTCGASQLQYVL